jgi:TolB protein
LFTSQPDGSDRTLIFSGEADAAPFYLYWSPDNQRIAFLAPAPSSKLAVWMADGHDADSSQIIARGSPSYFSWAPDGRSILLHIGDERIAMFHPDQSELTDLPDVPKGFQSPAWSPDGRRFLFARQADNRTLELVLAEGDDRRALASSRTGLAFAWSPRSDRIAFAIPSPADALLYGSVVVIDPEGKERRVAAQGQILAFFWSPDGKRLAVLNLDTSQPSPQGRAIPARAGAAPALQSAGARLAWSIVNVADGASVDFPPFYPTDPFLLLVPYFDQYVQSLSLWSPDGRSLVYADVDEHGAPSIRVLDTQQPQQPARRLSDGTFAAWSWH